MRVLYIAVRFDDSKRVYIKQCKDEGEVIREKEKFEGEYKLTQIANVGGPGFIFKAEKKKERKKFIWE